MICATRRPQVEPWHSPMPARVARLTASTVCAPAHTARTTSSRVTSSQRQITTPDCGCSGDPFRVLDMPPKLLQ